MKDMTRGPVAGHVMQLASFIALTMLFQTLYFLADLYFVGRLGKEAVAGVSLSGNLAFMVLALTQAIGVGATALVAQALGRKQREHAELVFNQALVLAVAVGLAFGLVAVTGREAYCRSLAADAATATLGVQYLVGVPALALQFPLVAMSAALRGMGDMKIPTAIQVSTVLSNIVLAPTLIFGWLSGRPLKRSAWRDRPRRRRSSSAAWRSSPISGAARARFASGPPTGDRVRGCGSPS